MDIKRYLRKEQRPPIWSTVLLFPVFALAAAALHPGQIMAGAAFQQFAEYTDRSCASRQLWAITPGDLSWEQEGFEDQLPLDQKKRLALANHQEQRCARSEGGLSCPTTQTLAAMQRTKMLPAFAQFACSHVAPTTVTVVGQEATARPTAAAILRQLDLDSFPNSTGPRRQPTLRTPADYGLTKVETFDDGWVQVSEPDNGWYMSALVLADSPEAATLCFLDTGGNGASYRATQVLDVHVQADGRWTARQVADRPDCRNVPPLPPKAGSLQDDPSGVPTFIPHHTMPPGD